MMKDKNKKPFLPNQFQMFTYLVVLIASDRKYKKISDKYFPWSRQPPIGSDITFVEILN